MPRLDKDTPALCATPPQKQEISNQTDETLPNSSSRVTLRVACHRLWPSMKRQVWFSICLCLLASRLLVSACMWDSTTLKEEEARHPNLADVILHGPPAPVERPETLRSRIKDLTANPRKDDPAWWNDLAGAHMRLGEPQAAVDLLETVTNRFPNDYGIHANLGTAYHLLGRYVEAEREIARDLEINPDAHFGLEKFHLALLQYLIRDAHYQ